jgi:hypothetical protein
MLRPRLEERLEFMDKVIKRAVFEIKNLLNGYMFLPDDDIYIESNVKER